MFNNVSRSTLVGMKPNGIPFRVPVATILTRMGENPNAKEWQNTWALQAVAQALVDAQAASGVVVLFDGNAILSAGEQIPAHLYN